MKDQVLIEKREVKYLGHFITDGLSGDRDIERQHCSLYAQGNMLIRKSYMCSDSVMIHQILLFVNVHWSAMVELQKQFHTKTVCRI